MYFRECWAAGERESTFLLLEAEDKSPGQSGIGRAGCSLPLAAAAAE